MYRRELSNNSEGLVLKSYEAGESGRVLRILSNDQGNVSCFAREDLFKDGELEPPSYIRFRYLEKGGMPVISERQTIMTYAKTKSDLDLYKMATFAIDIADRISRHGGIDEGLMQALLQCLKELDTSSEEPAVVLSRYLVILLVNLGSADLSGYCVGCGKDIADSERIYITMGPGGLLCERCRLEDPEALHLEGKVLEIFKSVLSKGGNIFDPVATKRLNVILTDSIARTCDIDLGSSRRLISQ